MRNEGWPEQVSLPITATDKSKSLFRRKPFYESTLHVQFISRGPDVFCYYEDISGGNRNLAEGQAVAFDMVEGPRGPHAKNVFPLTDSVFVS